MGFTEMFMSFDVASQEPIAKPVTHENMFACRLTCNGPLAFVLSIRHSRARPGAAQSCIDETEQAVRETRARSTWARELHVCAE
jgi:hypothetical protein